MTGPTRVDGVAVLDGVCPAGTTSVGSVWLREGDVYQVGRHDRGWAERVGLSKTHLALPRTTRKTVPAVALVLAVARAAVALQGGQRLIQILVDGQPLGPDPVRLAGPIHDVVIDSLGVPQRLRIGFGRARGERSATEPIPGSGTVVPVLRVSGSRLLPMAAALAWPLIPGVAPPLAGGWSTAQIAARHRELWGSEPQQPRRTLHDLRTLLTEAATEDGRPMATVPGVQPWPWPQHRQEAGALSEVEFAETKNRITGLYFAAAGEIAPMVWSALERPRRAAY